MASGTKLVLEFGTSNGGITTFSFNYAKPSTTTANVKALMNGIISNGDIFANVPATMKSAKLVTTNESAYDLI